MKTLQEAMTAERKKREAKEQVDKGSLKEMIKALNLPEDIEDGRSTCSDCGKAIEKVQGGPWIHSDGKQYRHPCGPQPLGREDPPFGGCDLKHSIINTSIDLMYYACGKDRVLIIECNPQHFVVKHDDFVSKALTLEQALKIIATWYLDLVEKYS